MKKYFLILFLYTIAASQIYCQESKKLKTIDFILEYDSANNNKNLREQNITQPPTFKGEIEALENYLKANISYSKKLLKTGLYGKNYLGLLIGANGEITHASFVKITIPYANCAKKIEELILKGGNWLPAQKEGKNVEAGILLTLTFNTYQ